MVGIRVGTLGPLTAVETTPNILTNSEFRRFWLSWDNDKIKVGYGFEIGNDIIMEVGYPSAMDINFMAILNGLGSGGSWEVYAGK